MRKWGTSVGAVVLAVGLVGAMAPAASAEELVPCETIFGEYLCQQMSDTRQFVYDTVGRLGPTVDEWRDRAAEAGKSVTDTVWCYVGGSCSPLQLSDG